MKVTQGSWKTTSTGMLAILGALVGLYFKRESLDEGTVMAALASVVTGIGLLVARDNNKSSEDVRVKSKDTLPAKAQTKIGLWLMGLCVAVTVGGCVTPVPGADPVIVQAEALAETSADALNAFVTWEYRNRTGLGRDVTAAADLVREFGPTYIRQLRSATKEYKAFRSQNNLDQTKVAIVTLQGLLDTIRNYYQTKSEP